MPFNANIIKVMIASPSDVAEERQVVREVLAEWNSIHSEDRGLVLLPVGWETHSSPTMGARPQAIINQQVLANCDLLIAVFWTRIGSPTGEAVSGTVEEIKQHLLSNKPAMLYFSSAPVKPDSVDEKQYGALRKFKTERFKNGLVESYESVNEFRDKLGRQLSQAIIRSYSATEATTAVSVASTVLGEAAKELLLEASEDKNGHVLTIRIMGGKLVVQTNGKRLNEGGDARSAARWEGAISELVKNNLLQMRGKGDAFTVTDAGYNLADTLRNASTS